MGKGHLLHLELKQKVEKCFITYAATMREKSVSVGPNQTTFDSKAAAVLTEESLNRRSICGGMKRGRGLVGRGRGEEKKT